MTTHSLFTLIAATTLLPGLAVAAKDGKARAKHPPQAAAASLPDVLKPFDKNSNQKIDADELPAVQQAFAALKNLDKNANGEIEIAEVSGTESHEMARAGEGRGRMVEAFKRVDKNGNHKIDADEIPQLQAMLDKAPGEMLKKLDQNGNGKLEESEIARLNERLAQAGRAGGRPAAPGSSSSSGFRRPPEKPADAGKPAETIKPAEKSDKPEDTAKPDSFKKPEGKDAKFGT